MHARGLRQHAVKVEQDSVVVARRKVMTRPEPVMPAPACCGRQAVLSASARDRRGARGTPARNRHRQCQAHFSAPSAARTELQPRKWICTILLAVLTDVPLRSAQHLYRVATRCRSRRFEARCSFRDGSGPDCSASPCLGSSCRPKSASPRLAATSGSALTTPESNRFLPIDAKAWPGRSGIGRQCMGFSWSARMRSSALISTMPNPEDRSRETCRVAMLTSAPLLSCARTIRPMFMR